MRRYFKATSTPIALSCRVLHFIEEFYKRAHSLVLSDAMLNLLSTHPIGEVSFNARSKYLVKHPLFALVSECDHSGYLATCTAMTGTMYAAHDVIFQADTCAAGLTIMARGPCELEFQGETQYFNLDEK